MNYLTDNNGDPTEYTMRQFNLDDGIAILQDNSDPNDINLETYAIRTEEYAGWCIEFIDSQTNKQYWLEFMNSDGQNYLI